MRLDHMAEVGEVCRCVLAAEKQATELLFKTLDGGGQRRLRHIAPFACARKIQFLRQRKEVANVVHFHSIPLSPQGACDAIARPGGKRPCFGLTCRSSSSEPAASRSPRRSFARFGSCSDGAVHGQ